MEDEIERNILSINKYITPKYIYLHTKSNIEKIFIENEKKAIEYSKKNKCKIEILYDKGDNVYRKSGDYINFIE